MVVGLLGILKAGAAYLPLDPQYPVERLSLMLNEAMTPVLVTHSALLDRLPSHWAHLVQLDEDWSQIASQPSTPPHSGVKPEHLAYAIYTSGSTGRRKGVGVTHRALCNHMQWMGERFPLLVSDVVLHKTSL